MKIIFIKVKKLICCCRTVFVLFQSKIMKKLQDSKLKLEMSPQHFAGLGSLKLMTQSSRIFSVCFKLLPEQHTSAP